MSLWLYFLESYNYFFLVPIYGLFTWAFTKSSGINDIVILYLIVVANRMRFAFSNVSKVIKHRSSVNSAMAALCYLILIFLAGYTNGVFGELGLSEGYLNSISYYDALPTGGLL